MSPFFDDIRDPDGPVWTAKAKKKRKKNPKGPPTAHKPVNRPLARAPIPLPEPHRYAPEDWLSTVVKKGVAP